MPWNPDQYHKFQSQRQAPFYDLLALVDIRPGLAVVDLGCGTGELTRRLADALPGSQVTGLDLSPEMLEKAAAHAREGLRFENGDQAQLSGTWDLIFSNAALHWTENHFALVTRLYDHLAPGGQLCIQMPSNHTHVSQRITIETAQEEPFFSALDGWVRYSPVLQIDQYAQILFDCGAEDILVFEKVYPHLLADSDAVVEWISGTTLVPYFERLGRLEEEFIAAIQRKLRQAMKGSPVFFPFKRTLLSARRPR